MSREIVILWAGRQRKEWEILCADYRRRIGRFLPISERVVRPSRGPRPQRLSREADSFAAALPDPAWTVALDRRGRQRSSTDLAGWLERTADAWPHPIAFVIGSDLGIEPGFVSDCRERLSLGRLTLPHELARLVLYEQLYRGLCINAGIKYHRGPS